MLTLTSGVESGRNDTPILPPTPPGIKGNNMKERRRVRAAPRTPAPREVVDGRELTLEEEERLCRMQYEARDQISKPFYKLSPALVRAVGYDHVGVLAFLIAWDRRHADPENRNWFYCPYRTIANALGIDARKVQREVKHYADLDVLQRHMENRRPRPRQWLRLLYGQIRNRAGETTTGRDE